MKSKQELTIFNYSDVVDVADINKNTNMLNNMIEDGNIEIEGVKDQLNKITILIKDLVNENQLQSEIERLEKLIESINNESELNEVISKVNKNIEDILILQQEINNIRL